MTNDGDLEINKGTELMLRRRAKRVPQQRKGLRIHNIFALHKKIFHFKLEITWEESTT
ncbi:hypothetical protein T040910_223 [Synechococcus phage S-CAM3]|uniref:Uncharacterized protein n=1 Tax=Synechococcus phage S-CAM3 TaxID=1883366 RepID=A0A1D8KK20_9CAUD|nr:hypothetical protein BOW87_gp034 [Synechococcus phage S-CAM3]AOV58728.1 hypothetical protein S250808_223 [Synechococcus phage S-CAM3]AOV58967.1 hypothetical protein T040910_223 [Synechococcus phage S-CAM3]AOV59207.1 hypothetical protein C421010_224 [Synechococcus phage S-CAM3]